MRSLFQQINFSLPALILASSLLFPASAAAINPEDLLSYDEAFVPSATVLDENTIGITFSIKPEHYMYRRFLEVTSGTDGISLAQPQLKPGVVKFDKLLDEEVETWHEKMVMTVAISERPVAATELILKIRSQGCLENVLCYPPTMQQLVIQLPAIQGLALPANNSSLGGLLGGQGNTSLFTGAKAAALAPEKAFVFEAIAMDAGELLIRFTPQPGYYLYRDNFQFKLQSAEGIEIVGITLPPGKIKDDPEFGKVQVYFDLVEIPILLKREAGPATQVQIQADFQGCRDGDICYPPMQRSISIDLPAASEAINAELSPVVSEKSDVALIGESDRLAQLLLEHPWKAMLAFFGLGLLLAFTPCVFPMVPILSGIIAGEGKNITTRRAFILSLVYVLAMALTYTAVGLVIGAFGQNLQAVFQNPWIIASFSAIFVLLALSMFGFYELQLPTRLQTRLSEMSNSQEGGKIIGVAIMGVLSALIVGPCVAPPMMAALIVIGGAGDVALGGGALFAMSLGMGAPLLIIGASAGKLLPRAGAWMDTIKAVFGIGLLGLAIWMLERILPGGMIMWLWGALLISSGVYMGALEPVLASGWSKLWKSIGVILVIVGMLEIIGAIFGGDDWTRPMHSVNIAGNQSAEIEHLQFRQVRTIADVDTAVLQAKAQGKTVMLDFYADWCIECKRMERNAFSDTRVQAALSNTVLLQADSTIYDEDAKALVNHYSLIGPPSILFFDLQGNERKSYRVIGYMPTDEFLLHINAAIGGK